MMKTILHVIGARPNYMKVAPLVAALRTAPLRQVLVNTGQHYDDAMAGIFQREFQMPSPDYDLGVGSASHAVQTAQVMMRFEEVCQREKPDLVVVVGDVNSTMAATLVASKLLIPVAHVEAGLRSFDRTMPEELNRLVTDQLADLLLTPSEDGNENLRREGVPESRVFLVGNIMIDTLMRCLPAAAFSRVADRFPIAPRGYAVMTLHRPSNVDVPEHLEGILAAVTSIGRQLPVVFAVHPRTRARLEDNGHVADGILFSEPLGYLDFLALTSNARVVLTDSGGLQEESTALGIPCLTLRENTERPITIAEGTNQLVGIRPTAILEAFEAALDFRDTGRRPPLWDGRTAERIVGVFRQYLAA
jgi:UDP-N-acetylglucosamine 2-epimerase (non-hydrolysing)